MPVRSPCAACEYVADTKNYCSTFCRSRIEYINSITSGMPMQIHPPEPGDIIRRKTIQHDPHRRMTSKDKQNIDRMIAAGTTNPVIAMAVGFSPAAIVKYRHRIGMQQKPRVTQEEVAKIRAMGKTGASINAIAKEFRRSWITIKTAIQTA